jgi:hypothetical protein
VFSQEIRAGLHRIEALFGQGEMEAEFLGQDGSPNYRPVRPEKFSFLFFGGVAEW